VDDQGRPRVLLLSAGNTNDITMARDLVEAAGPLSRLLADRGYDADHLRKLLAERGVEAVIPTTTSRRAPIPYNVVRYRQRNKVERLWARLKDFRRVATRYDKLAANFLAGVQIAALVAFWAK
jgi:transposase